jgi:hypothetical protein
MTNIKMLEQDSSYKHNKTYAQMERKQKKTKGLE